MPNPENTLPLTFSEQQMYIIIKIMMIIIIIVIIEIIIIIIIIDVACPFDTRVKQKEEEKLDHYNELKYQTLKIWKDEVKKVAIIPVVIGALGVVSKRFKSYIAALDFDPGVQPLQKACRKCTARIVRKVLDTRE